MGGDLNRPPTTEESELENGDRLRSAGQVERAIEAYLNAAATTETPRTELCLKLARCYQALGHPAEATRWALGVVDAGTDFTAWRAAADIIRRSPPDGHPAPLRQVRLATVGSYTTAQLTSLLRLAARRFGFVADIRESDYGQYRQDILDADSGMYAFAPDSILIAVHDGEVALPEHSESPAEETERELRRWTSLWQAISRRSSARVIQHNFAIPPEVAFGHLATRLPGSRYRMLQALNQRLGDEAGNGVAIVDCERLSALVGKQRWFDPRYWFLAKQAVSLEALPLLARHTAAVIAADLGLTRKCLVLDLDNTLWGGVIGEDGLAGIQLGGGPAGEAFVAFQDYILKLKERGVILAVSSKNNDADAREPFLRHPEMRIKLDDVSIFEANWEPKADVIRRIARRLNIGLDSIIFVDDNPAERQSIRELLPEVEVLQLPEDPCRYTRCLANCLLLDPGSFTPEDSRRTEQYRARAQIAELESAAQSLDDFHRGLQMRAVIESFNEFDLPRLAQLVGKTNQFNVTTRRHSMQALQKFMLDPRCVHFSLRLRDRFADHGLVSLMIAFVQGDTLDIDTWLMSCRVIGRTVEATMLHHLCRRAAELGCTSIRGTYVPTDKNAMVEDVFARFGFDPDQDSGTPGTWCYDLEANGLFRSGVIEVVVDRMGEGVAAAAV